MSTIYRCVGCDLHYCADCDGGHDSCDTCHLGPWCPDCAADDAADHRAEETEGD